MANIQTPMVEEYVYYVVIAYYRGHRELHSYPVFINNDKESAIEAAEKQTTYRGGMYSCVVYEMKEGSYDQEPVFEEVYETEIPYKL